MATYRGLSVDGTSLLPVSSISMSVARNLISEETMSSVGEAKIYGGTFLASGSIEAPYRTDIDILIKNLFGGEVTGGPVDLPATPYFATFNVSDEYGNGYTVASVIITSMDLNVQTKDFAKVSFNWLGGKTAGATHNFSTAASYANPLGVFYNTVISVSTNGTDYTPVKCTTVSVKVERPIDQDYYILGSEFLQDIVQSGALTVSGSVGIAAKDWSDLQRSLNLANEDTIDPSLTNKNGIEFGTISIKLSKPDGSSVFRTINIPNVKIDQLSASVQGRNKFEKSITWKAETTPSAAIKFS